MIEAEKKTDEATRILIAKLTKPPTLIGSLKSAADDVIDALPIIAIGTIVMVLAMPVIALAAACFLAWIIFVTVSPRLGTISISAAAVIIVVLQRFAP